MKRVRASKVRNLLGTIVSRLPSDGLTTEKIIADLRRDHPDAIAAETGDLIEIALVRLVSQVSSLRSSSTVNFQVELFEEYAVKRRIVLMVETPTGFEKVWKNIDDVTVAEAERYVALHERVPVRLSVDAKELSRLLTDVRNYATSPNDKLVNAWAAARDAKK
jgi:predicted nucleic acid-binding protein